MGKRYTGGGVPGRTWDAVRVGSTCVAVQAGRTCSPAGGGHSAVGLRHPDQPGGALRQRALTSAALFV